MSDLGGRSLVIHDYGERIVGAAPDDVVDWLNSSAVSAGWTLLMVDPFGRGRHVTWVDAGDSAARKAQLVAVITPLNRGGCRVHLRER